MIWKFKCLFVALILILPLSSCSDKSQDPEEPSVIISDNVYIVEDDGPLTLELVDDTTLIFSYEGTVPDIPIGNKIIGTEHNGYLREVLSINVEQSRLLIETGEAKLADVIQRGGFQTTIQLDGINLNRSRGIPGVKVLKLAEGVEVLDDRIDLTGVVIFSNNSLEVKIISGEIQFTPDLDIGFEFENWSIIEFHTIATGSLSAYADFRATAFGPFSNTAESTLAAIEYGPFVYYIGWMPIVATITLSFTAGYEFSSNLHLNAQTGFEANATVMAGARYAEYEWETIWDHGQDFEERSTNWQAGGTISLLGYIKPEIEVTFFTVAGPYLNIEPYFSFNGGIQYPNWWWNLNAGLTGTLGFQVSILDRMLANFDTELLAWEREIGSDSGSNPHIVSPDPNTPSGPSSGETGQPLTYSTGGSSCSQGHDVEYQFSWGDGNSSSWGSLTRYHSWSDEGTFCVKAKARCTVDNSVTSGWSDCKYVDITQHTETAFLRFSVWDSDNSWHLDSTNVERWNNVNPWYIKYSDLTGHQIENPSWGCPGDVQIIQPDGTDDRQGFYFSEFPPFSDLGLVLDPSCNSVTVTIQASLESWYNIGGFFTWTDDPDCTPYAFSFGFSNTNCETRNRSISGSYIYAPAPIEINIGYEDTYPGLGDDWSSINIVRFTFNGWEVPRSILPINQAPVVVINSEKGSE